MAFCKNCGVQLKEEERFCPNCGTSVNGAASTQTSTKVSIDTKKLEDGLVSIKDAVIKLLKNPFKGASDAHEILNPFSSCLFAVLLSIAYGLTALWTKSALTEQLKKPFKGTQIFRFISSIISAAFRAASGKTFWLTFLTIILSIAIIFALLYLASKVMLKQDQSPTKLLNAAIFPFVIFLVICLVENVAIYISLIFYIILAAIGILFLVVYLYHNIALVISNNGEHSAAVYTSALSFVCITIVYNMVLLNGITASLTNSIQSTLKGLI
jgi:hypothetical protein